ncbi:MAG: DoxX family protein [Gemmatimonadota bacterium]
MSTITLGTPSTRARRAGLVLLILAALFLAFDTTIKLIASPEALEGTKALGWPVGVVRPLGLVCLVLLVLLLVPQTAPLGAILWTAYLGGAVATHVRVGNPLFSHLLFPTYVAAIIWTALYLRDTRVRALVARRP